MNYKSFAYALIAGFLAVGFVACNNDSVEPEPIPVAVTEVTINRTDALLGIEGTAMLVATVLPTDAADKTVSWTSDNKAVATVDEAGLVTAAGTGTATITATAGTKTAKCTVTVDSDIVVATDLTLDKYKLIIDTGKNETLSATISPGTATFKTLEWDSSDIDVATVEDGVVTGVDAGKAFITVTTADGSLAAVCEVTVEVAVTGVGLNKEELELGLGDGETLTATIAPEDATHKEACWSSNNIAVATVSDNGTVVAVGTGEATITVTTIDEGKTATCKVTVVEKAFWSRSNVVWVEDGSKPEGGYLTFAITAEDNAVIPANVQGVQFLCGSLVAISPVAGYTAGQHPDGSIVYSPTGSYSYKYDYSATPAYLKDSSAPFGVANVGVEEDDFATYNAGTGFDAVAGNGDICRFISSKGWVADSWRLPTAQEYLDLIAENAAGSVKYGDFAKIGSIPAGESAKGDNAYGFYQIPSARMLGGGAAEGDDIAAPVGGVIMPASGYRDAYGTYNAGSEGNYQSASSNTTSNQHSLMVSASSASKGNVGRSRAMSVRCVRAE